MKINCWILKRFSSAHCHVVELFCVQIFIMFDTDQSGTFTAADLEYILMGFGSICEEDELRDIKERVVEKGYVTWQNFLELMADILLGEDPHKKREEEARMAFDLMDADGGGTISPVELRHLMANLGEIIPDEEVDKMITQADIDGGAGSSWHWQLSVLVDR